MNRTSSATVAYYQSFGKVLVFVDVDYGKLTYFQFLVCFHLRRCPFSFWLIFILDVAVPSMFSGNIVSYVFFEILTFYDDCAVAIMILSRIIDTWCSREYFMWNAVSVPLLRVCTVADKLILKYIRVANLPLTSTVTWPHNSLGLYIWFPMGALLEWRKF